MFAVVLFWSFDSLSSSYKNFSAEILANRFPIISWILFKGDFIKLQQVLFNILGNAVKFSPENSEIKISAKTQGDKVVIKIKDEGIGIAKKYHKKIFDK